MADDKMLAGLRAKIDRLDLELMNVLMERMKIVDDIGSYKKEHDEEVRNEKRRSEVLSDRIARGKSRGLSGEMVRDIFESIIRHSEERQK